MTTGSDGEINLWDPLTGETKDTSEREGLACLAISADGKTVAAGGQGKPISLWDVRSGRQIASFNARGHSAYSLSFAPSMPRLGLRRRGRGNVHIWNLITKAERIRISEWALSELSLEHGLYSTSGKFMAATQAECIRLLDAVTGREIRQLLGHDGYVMGLAFSPDERFLASAAHAYVDKGKSHDDYSVRIWDVRAAAKSSTIFQIPIQPSRPLALDGQTLAYLSQGRLHCRDLHTGQEAPPFRDLDVTSFAFSPDGCWLATAHQQGEIQVREWATWQPILHYEGRTGRCFAPLLGL